MFDEKREVVDTVSERREEKSDDGESVEEVFTEPVISDFIFKFSVCSGDDTHINGDSLWGADAFDFALFEDSEKFWLKFEA